MSDDNPTRIVRPTPPPDGDPASATRPVRGGAATGARQADVDPATRMIGGLSRPVEEGQGADTEQVFELAVGWLVVIDGPGKGVSREIYFGMNSLGRSIDERISLDFGDTAISREAHAYIVYDEKQSDFYIQHGGKSNLVRLNGAAVISPQPLQRGDVIEIGSTKLMFVPLCGDDFSWEASAD